MARECIVEPNQSMEDIALQYYGTVDAVRELLFDNEGVFTDGFSSYLTAGTVLQLRDEPLDRAVYETAKKLSITPSTSDSVVVEAANTDGDYSNDHNNDHLITV